MMPVIEAQEFAPSLTDNRFTALFQTNKFRLMRLAWENHWYFMKDIRGMLLPPLDHWRALQIQLQIQNFLTSILDGFTFDRWLSLFERHCLDPSPLKQALSKSYTLLCSSDKQTEHILYFAHRASIATRI